VSLQPGELVPFARGELLQGIEAAQERIWLASPFISAPIASYVVKSAAKAPGTAEKKLLTALVGGSVRVRALDPKALLILQEGGFEVRSIQTLHAKVSIVDSDWALVGSGNLTNAGLGSTERGNVELGVILNPVQVAVAAAIYAGWWDEALPVSRELIEEFDALPRIRRKADEPPDYGTVVEPPQTAALDEILAEDIAAAHSRGYWIKSAYHSPTRPDWWHRNWISDPTHPRYEIGDLIVIYLTGKDGGPQACPSIVRVSSSSRNDPEWVIKHRDAAAAGQWPWVTETTFVADVAIADAVSLTLIDKAAPQTRATISRKEFEVLARTMRARKESAQTA
jgi:hypothetical protein